MIIWSLKSALIQPRTKVLKHSERTRWSMRLLSGAKEACWRPRLRGRRALRAAGSLGAHARSLLNGSFSAVSTPILTTKQSFFRNFQDLQDLHNSAPLESQNLAIFEISSKIMWFWRNFEFSIFTKFCKFSKFLKKNLENFDKFSNFLSSERCRSVQIL